jgi:hypothetical protein
MKRGGVRIGWLAGLLGLVGLTGGVRPAEVYAFDPPRPGVVRPAEAAAPLGGTTPAKNQEVLAVLQELSRAVTCTPITRLQDLTGFRKTSSPLTPEIRAGLQCRLAEARDYLRRGQVERFADSVASVTVLMFLSEADAPTQCAAWRVYREPVARHVDNGLHLMRALRAALFTPNAAEGP